MLNTYSGLKKYKSPKIKTYKLDQEDYVTFKTKNNEKKFEGHLQIELTNVKTGEKEVIEAKNIVTNAVHDLLETNPFGLGEFSAQNAKDKKYWLLPACNLFGSIILFGNQQDEVVENIHFDPKNPPLAWAGNKANVGICAQRGNPTLSDTHPVDDGYQFVWEWATDRGNGTYQSVSLSHGETGNTDATFLNRYDATDAKYALFGRMEHRDPGIGGTSDLNIYPPTAHTKTTSNYYDADFIELSKTVYVDREKGLWYAVVPKSGSQLEIKVYKREITKIPLGQVNLKFNNDPLDMYNYYAKLVETQTYSLSTSIAKSMSSVSVDDDGIIYIFSASSSSNEVIVTKIDPVAKTCEQKTNIYYGCTFYISKQSQEFAVSGSSYHMTKDAFAFLPEEVDGKIVNYIYIPCNSNNTAMYKLAVDNVADISYVPQDETITEALKIHKANFNDRKSGIWTTQQGYGIFQNKLGATSGQGLTTSTARLIQISDLLYVAPYTGHGDYVSHSIVMNTFYKATVKNVPAFTKTSDMMMKITYTIRETEE